MSNVTQIAEDLPVHALRERLALLPELWKLHTERQSYEGTAHAESETIFIRGPAESSNPLDQLECFQDDLVVLELGLGLAQLMDAVDSLIGIREVGRVMLVKLPPGGRVLPHTDTGLYARYFARFHCVIQGKCWFRCGGESYFPLPGDLFTFNHQIEHDVFVSEEEVEPRIHLIFDATAPGYTGAIWRPRE